jgi:hypothetical protein
MNTGDLGHLHALPTWFGIVQNCHTALNKFSEEVQHFTTYILGVCWPIKIKLLTHLLVCTSGVSLLSSLLLLHEYRLVIRKTGMKSMGVLPPIMANGIAVLHIEGEREVDKVGSPP